MAQWDDDPSPDTSTHGGVQVVPFKTSTGSLQVHLLHGNLDVWVKEARNLPNMDLFHKRIGDIFMNSPSTNTSDPYVVISVCNAVIGRTFVIDDTENPVWMQHFYVPVAHYASEVHFVVKDADVVGSQLIGAVGIPVDRIIDGTRFEGTFPVLNASGKPCKAGAILTLSIQYIPVKNVPLYRGIRVSQEFQGVPGTYFPLRRGGRVTLYQDAHVPEGNLPSILLDNDVWYQQGQCWRDIFEAIGQARRLIYITGWSVYHLVRLVRHNEHSQVTLGDLLKSKSQEGVRVLLLVWDDPTSRSILGYKTDGIMQTNDEKTRRFFKNSSVKVLLCPRSAGKGHSWAKKQETETIYTHHQKTIILDADAGNYKRRIVSFVGGLDVCKGRYDTPNHALFSTLQTIHNDDYHNPNFTGTTAGCPREPWHDLHSRIDGPAAYDVLTNFEERWLKASSTSKIKKKIKSSFDDALLSLSRIPDILGQKDNPCLHDDHPDAWHVQIFRSIDSNSVKGFPKDPKQATSRNLVCGKNVLIDMSIHTAYVKAIRAAQHFIYIENQYFLGSSFNWGHYKDLGANNLIPIEIALKIAEKIRSHERFAAYIVVPMWPEGDPKSTATQRILFWQYNTMQMMYETIYKALVEVGLESSYEPQDYLNFFCLGNREAPDNVPISVPKKVAHNTPEARTQKNRRFMIYVHSKGMIVDDEYVIIGSANINQRSLEGSRDTEIAMGAYQPYHTWQVKSDSPKGQIYGYRMSLWSEHIGFLESTFEKPETIECVRRVRTLSEYYWEQFAGDEIVEMKGHLLKYPVLVNRTGKVRSIPGRESFPDMGGHITGAFSAIQENLTI